MTSNQAPPIRAVFFDLDDTLWPIAPVIARAEQEMHAWLTENAPALARDYSIECLRKRRMALLLAQPEYRINLSALRHAVLCEACVAAGEDQALAAGALAAFLKARHAVELFDDVVPVLSQLGQRVMLGTISNGVADLPTIGLHHHFRVSIAAHQIGCAKPEAAIFHAACENLGVAPEHCVYVGDDLQIDILGAQGAGMRARGPGDGPCECRGRAGCAPPGAAMAARGQGGNGGGRRRHRTRDFKRSPAFDADSMRMRRAQGLPAPGAVQRKQAKKKGPRFRRSPLMAWVRSLFTARRLPARCLHGGGPPRLPAGSGRCG